MTFFERIVSLLSESDNHEAKNKKIVKRLSREINQNKFRKFYKIGSEEINPALGTFFYDIYKTIVPAQEFMKNAAKSTLLKQLTIEAFLNKELRGIHERLCRETIEEQAKTMPLQELSHQLEQDLAVFSSAFTTSQINLIDQCYNLIMTFAQFVEFDFFSLLKKLDPRLRERDFVYQPQFRRVSGKYLVGHLKDFLGIPFLEAKWDEWKIVFEILKRYKNGTEVINVTYWKKLVSYILDVQRSDILVLIIRHIDKNINWQRDFQISDEYIVETYLKAKQTEIQTCIDRMITDKRASKRDSLATMLFGSTDITRLRYYTNNSNEVYVKRSLEGFIYINALNYLKAFLINYNDIHEICDLFLIRGQWASQDLSRQMSQVLHQITDIINQLADFDESLSDGGRQGAKLKHLVKPKMDKGQLSYLKVVLDSVNDEALVLINDAVSSFTNVGSHLNELLEDYQKPHPKLVVNWKEIESVSEVPIDQRIQNSYKAIDSFVQLLELFVPSN